MPFFGIGMKTDLFQSCGHSWIVQICWHIECRTFTASSFRIWKSSARIPSPPLALFLLMLPKVHLTLQSRMSGSRWVITPSWLSGPWRYFWSQMPSDSDMYKVWQHWCKLIRMSNYINIYVCVCVCVCELVVFNSATPCTLAKLLFHGILQARILEWVAIPSSRGSPQPRDQTWVSCIAGRFFTIWASREALTIYTVNDYIIPKL